jgi:adenosine deaminase
VEDIRDHPVRRYVDRGLRVTINTDDPRMFGNTLADEFRVLSECFDFTRQEIRQLIVQGIEASWLPVERQQQLIVDCTGDPAWNETW